MTSSVIAVLLLQLWLSGVSSPRRHHVPAHGLKLWNEIEKHENDADVYAQALTAS